MKRICLAYSGGLDTSVIAKWLIDNEYEVVCFMADVGQEEDFESARKKALKIGASEVVIEDLKEVFLKETIYQAIMSNCLYEQVYHLGTALARPIIARAQVETAVKYNCTHIGHGCTGKGNDQLRFELAYMALKPSLKIVAPWRLKIFFQEFQGRQDLLKYAETHKIPVDATPKKPWSMDENMYHISYEAGILEDPEISPPIDMWKKTLSLFDASSTPDNISVEFSHGIPSKLTHNTFTITEPMAIFNYFSELGKKHGIGRIDIVENRCIGMKSRGCYETPAYFAINVVVRLLGLYIWI
eukprot:NODE_722_length_4795_cov_0.504898.p2 type:complete len:299 gc:universal NODE_722_length_4795_cov_0.504898:3986-3090(-)